MYLHNAHFPPTEMSQKVRRVRNLSTVYGQFIPFKGLIHKGRI